MSWFYTDFHDLKKQKTITTNCKSPHSEAFKAADHATFITLYSTDDGVTIVRQQLFSKNTELWKIKVKVKPEFLKFCRRSRNDGGLALDLLMKNRALLWENIRKWGWGRTLTNLAGKRGYHGTDKKPEGLSSKGEIRILIWSLIFSSHSGHLCLFIYTKE